jgi:hypothetical protein
VDIVDVLAKIDHHLHMQDIYLTQLDERLGRQDRMLELQTEAIRLIHVGLDRQNQILRTMDESVERVSQHTVQIAQLCADHTMSLERQMQAFERLMERLDARGEEPGHEA